MILDSVSLLSVVVLIAIFLGGDAQRVVPGKKYHFSNPNFPGKYSPGSSESWDLDSDLPITVTCLIFDIPYSFQCMEEVFIIEDGRHREKFCSNTRFTYTTKTNQVTISYYSTRNARGGTFSCEFETSKKICTATEYFYDRLYQRNLCDTATIRY